MELKSKQTKWSLFLYNHVIPIQIMSQSEPRKDSLTLFL